MTGYALASCNIAGGKLNFEIRSVNSRYLDLSIRCDDVFRVFEVKVRQLVGAAISRGKLEVRIYFANCQENSPLTANKEYQANAPSTFATEEAAQMFDLATIAQVLAAQNYLKQIFPEASSLSIGDICQWPGVLLQNHLPIDLIAVKLDSLVNSALQQLQDCRVQEGKILADIIKDKISLMRLQLDLIKPYIAEANAQFENKIRRRLSEIVASNDQDRIAQELSIYAVKNDISEEIDRLKTHLSAVEAALLQKTPCGKRLDFLMQELNREANTLAAKAAIIAISDAALELKLLIEQMREQVQNIE